MCGCEYYEGYWTALDGQEVDANPYELARDPSEWLNWRDGWEDAQNERRVSDR